MIVFDFSFKYKIESAAKRETKEKDEFRQKSRINIGDQAGWRRIIRAELSIKHVRLLIIST